MILSRTIIVLAILAAIGVAIQAVIGQPSVPADLGPKIRRVTLSDERAQAALLQVEERSLIRMTPVEFDRLIAPPGPPRPRPTLVSARYRARLVTDKGGESSLRGTAELAIRHSGPGSGVLRLDDLQIALRQAKWSDGEDAILYKSPADAHPCLYVPHAGDQSLNLDWSVRGIPEPGELRFELRLPAAPIAFVELELPANITPVITQADVLVTGPFPSGANDQLWRVACGRITRVEVVLSQLSTTPGPLFVQTNTIQTLAATDGSARFEFQVETSRTGFSQLTFRHDPAFQPVAVTVNNLLSWTANDGKPTIVVELREPTRSVTVVLTGTLAIPPGAKPWTSPDAWLVGGISRGERLRIAIPSALTLREWSSGDYALVRGQPSADRVFAIDVESALAASGPVRPARPSLVVMPRRVAVWSAAQTATWTVGPETESWQVRTVATVTAGSLNTMQFAIPADWEVERIEGNSPDISWSISQASPSRLRVELGRGARRGDRVEVTVRFRGKRPLRSDALLVAPDLLPDSSDERSGTLSIRVDPAWDAILSDAVPSPSTTVPPREPAEVSRILSAEALIGTITLHARRPRGRVEITSDAISMRSGSVIRTLLTVVPEAGTVSDLQLWNGPASGPWVWRDADGRHVADAIPEPIADVMPWLLAMAPGPPLVNVAGPGGISESTRRRWLLHFPRPLTQSTTLVSEYPVTLSVSRAWPFPGVAGIPFNATARIPAFTEDMSIPAWLLPIGTEIDGTCVFHYGMANGPPAARIGVSPLQADAPQLITTLLPDGRRAVDFRVRVRGRQVATTWITLPVEAEAICVSVAGRSVAVARSEADSRKITIPVPASVDWVPLEVRYSLAATGGTCFDRLSESIPSGPFDPATVRRVWHVSPEWILLNRSELRALRGRGDLPSPLPLPDWRAFNGRRASHSVLSDFRTAMQRGASFREALERTCPSQLVLIDVRAASSAGLTPANASSPNQSYPLLDPLVAVPWKGGVLVTGVDDVRVWQASSDWDGHWPADVMDALETAVDLGSDASGQFRTLANWMANPVREEEISRAPPGWAVVEGVSGTGDVIVVRRDRTWTAGWAVGLGLVLLSVMPRLRRVRAVGLLFAVLVACAVALVLPGVGSTFAMPIVFSTGAGYLLALLRAHRPTASPEAGSAVRPASAAAVATSLLFATAWAIAADRPTVDVFQILDVDGRPIALLLAPDTLDRLLRDRGIEPNVPNIAITGATYSGSREGGAVRFRGKFQLFAFHAGPSGLELPLGGARLRSVAVDGSEAGELGTMPNGVRVVVQGKGPHTIDVDFTVPITEAGSDREVRFSVPEVPISRLTMDSPAPGIQVRTSNWRGAIRHADNLTEVDHGLAPVVSLRWTGEGSVEKPTTLVKEASVWQVGPASNVLTSLFEFRVSAGSLSSVRIAVPSGAEVYRLTATAEPVVVTAPPVRVRDWRLGAAGTGPHRTLTVDLLTPVSGRVTVRLEMIAVAVAGDRATLHIPHALDVAESESHAALVSQGSADLALLETDGLVEAPIEVFGQTVWNSLSGTAYPIAVSRAYRATGIGVPRLVVPIGRTATTASARESATWWIGPTQIVGVGETRWSTGGSPLMEWTVPADVKLVAVTGRNLQSWSQSGGKVQAWLSRPTSDADLSWRAVRARGPLENRANIPVCGHAAAAESTITRVIPVDGQSLLPIQNAPGLTLMALQRPGELTWRSSGMRDVPLPIATPLTSRRLGVHTTLRAAGERIEAESSIDLGSLPTDRPHVLSLYVPATKDAEIRVEVPTPLTVVEAPTEYAGLRWDVRVPAGHTGPRFATVSVSYSGSGPRPLTRFRVFSGPRNEVSLSQSVSVESPVTLHDLVGLVRAGAEWTATVPDWSATLERANSVVVSDRENLQSVDVAPPRFSNDSPVNVSLDSAPPSRPWARVGLVVLIGLLVGVFALVWPKSSAPEQAAGIGIIGTVTFGPAAAVLLLIPAIAILWRVRRTAIWLIWPSPWRQNSTTAA